MNTYTISDEVLSRLFISKYPFLVAEKRNEQKQCYPHKTLESHNFYKPTIALTLRNGEDPQEVIASLTAPALSVPGRLWNVPFPPNPFFIGREEILKQLEQNFFSTQKVALTQVQAMKQQAISGLGGVGKTQTAIEYADRHREQYQKVLWAQADTGATLDIEFGKIATLLNLPEKGAEETEQIREAVKRWLAEEKDYLLILDNADMPELLTTFLPPQLASHLLLTSRAYSFGKMNIYKP